MAKKRLDVDKALNELTENVKKIKPTPESLLSELESSINGGKSDIESRKKKSVERKSFRTKDSLGFQIENPNKYVPKTQYSKYLIRFEIRFVNVPIEISFLRISHIIATKGFA